MVPRRPDPRLEGSRQLGTHRPSARPQGAARHARQRRQRRRVGAMPDPRRRQVLAGLHRHEAPRRLLQGRAQLHRHGGQDRRPVVGPGLRQFVGLRPVAVPRRRRPQVVSQPGLGLSRPAAQVRRHRHAGVRSEGRQAHRPAQQHLPRHRPRPDRGAASLQARRQERHLVLPDHRRGRHRLQARRHHGAVAHHWRTLRGPPDQAHHHRQGCAGEPAAARRPCRLRRDAGRARLPRPPHEPAERRPALGVAGARRRSRRWSGATTTGCG